MGNPLPPRSINSHNDSGDGKGVCASIESSCFVHALLEMRNQFVPVGGGNGSGREVEGREEEKRVMAGHRNPPFMTKSELSDMVLGVRELSKHLGELEYDVILHLGKGEGALIERMSSEYSDQDESSCYYDLDEDP